MGLNALNHYSIRAADLEATRAFYVDVLGLQPGYRPNFDFPGHWLYCGSEPTVHLIGLRARDAHLPREPGPTGLIDHIAFTCTGLADMQARLAARGIAHETRIVPRDRQTQLFLLDPNGISVELNYSPEETPA